MTLHFRTPDSSYDIELGQGILARAGSFFDLERKVLVVTEEGVPCQYARTLLEQCPQGFVLVLPGGEGNKTLAGVERILSTLLDNAFTRTDAIVAVGGGVVGDMAGFAASCYMRGIDYYNVPTTLLSQVDSSVGGKTGVNLCGVKNAVGSFRQPAGVLIDTLTLDTLDPRLYAEGLAELFKMAATCDAGLFRRLETAESLRPADPELLASALRIKIGIVEQDPSEKGLRAVLNFGHTIGHAIEAAAASGPAPLYHGEAVAVGMMYASEGQARERLGALLRRAGLPTEDDFSVGELARFASRDKKRKGALTKVVKVSEIGSYRFEELDDRALVNLISARK